MADNMQIDASQFAIWIPEVDCMAVLPNRPSRAATSRFEDPVLEAAFRPLERNGEAIAERLAEKANPRVLSESLSLPRNSTATTTSSSTSDPPDKPHASAAKPEISEGRHGDQPTARAEEDGAQKPSPESIKTFLEHLPEIRKLLDRAVSCTKERLGGLQDEYRSCE